MDAALRLHVRERARDRCEYCRIPQSADPFLRFHIEHITPRQHGGSDEASNLALACGHCNRHKGPNLAGIDPATGLVVALYHPRDQAWTEHFDDEDGVIVGKTGIGRATAELLGMNEPRRVELRVGYNETP